MLSGAKELKTQIPQNTLLFSEIEYLLKLALTSSTAKITSCYLLSNPHLEEPFTRLSQQSLTLKTIVDAVDLVGANIEEDVIKRGFQIPEKKGHRFTVGSFRPKNVDQTIHRAIICDIAVGRSFTADEKTAETEQIPDGYDSFFLSEDGSKDSDYNIDYVFKHAEKIHPRYLIQFEYDSHRESLSRQKPKCDDCEVASAVVYCEADKAFLCSKCDGNLHRTKITKNHTRTPVGQGVDVFGNCKTHPTRDIQYFCSQCHEPICIDCTIMGSHAKVDKGQHTLVSVQEYFKTVMEEIQVPNPHLQQRKIDINGQIGNIRSRADAVVEMGADIIRKIDEACALAKKQCDSIIERKLTVLLGDENELKRQMGEIEQLEAFLKYQQEGESMQCVYTWHLHQLLCERLSDFSFFRKEIDVLLDAKIDGSISVVIDRNIPSQPASPVKQSSPQRRTNAPPSRVKSPLPSAPAPTKTKEEFLAPIPAISYSSNSLYPEPNLPQARLNLRKVERRISDFFQEALSMANDQQNEYNSKYCIK